MADTTFVAPTACDSAVSSTTDVALSADLVGVLESAGVSAREIEVPMIAPGYGERLKKAFLDRFGPSAPKHQRIVFARVNLEPRNRVIPDPEYLLRTVVTYRTCVDGTWTETREIFPAGPSGEREPVPPRESFPADAVIQEYYSRVFALATETGTHGAPRRLISASEKHACELDLTDLGAGFGFGARRSTDYCETAGLIWPRGPQYEKDPATGENRLVNQGHLICGIVSTYPNGKHYFSRWALCTEQLLHARDLITNGGKDEADFHKALKGNYLCTNSARKSGLGRLALGDPEASLHPMAAHPELTITEKSSYWVHALAALVLMIRFNEVPWNNNIPRNLDGSPCPVAWDLPEGWLNALFDKYEVKLTMTKVRREVMILKPRAAKSEVVAADEGSAKAE